MRFRIAGDVRLGHKTRQAALEELDDDIDEAKVRKTLSEVGYPAERKTQEKRLASYIVPKTSMPSTSELRAFLSERLPPYMIPSYFVPPRQSAADDPWQSGPRHAPAIRTGSQSAIPATRRRETISSRRLVEIFQNVLLLEQVGIHDDFLELGGDSILNIQIVVRAGRAGSEAHAETNFRPPHGGGARHRGGHGRART